MLKFVPINLAKHQKDIIKFRRDSFIASFGDDSGMGEENEYLDWLKQKMEQFPDGYRLLEEDGRLIGQIELSIREYQETLIGYVHLYYLIPEKRCQGLGTHLHNYAKKFFKSHKVNEYQLRVSPSNKQALKFYHRMGMEELYPEYDGKVIRMKGTI